MLDEANNQGAGDILDLEEKEQIEKKPEQVLYDPEARNRFSYTVTEGGQQYDTAHIFNSLSDERYLKWVSEFHIKGNTDHVTEEGREASCRLWNDLIESVENVEPDVDIRVEIPSKEKIKAVNDLLTIATFDPEVKATGLRRPGAHALRIVLTEAYQNGKVTQQTHTLKEPTIEWQKKYARIQSKRFKQEQTRGLRRKPKIEHVPQDGRIAEMYDDMLVKVEGFHGDWVPVRLKTAVIHFIFESEMEASEKK